MFKDFTHAYNGTDATLEILILLAVAFFFGMLFAYFLWAPKKSGAVAAPGTASPAPAANTPSVSVENNLKAVPAPLLPEPQPETPPIEEMTLPVETVAAEALAEAPEVIAEAPAETRAAEEIEMIVEVTSSVVGLETSTWEIAVSPETAVEEPLEAPETVVEELQSPASDSDGGATEAELAHLENLLSEASRGLDEAAEESSAFDRPVEIADAPSEDSEAVAELSFELPPLVLESTLAPATDNFRLLEGIGIVVERTLKEGGFQTFAQLAEASPEAIMAVLLAASERNKRFQSVSTSWPEQAALARDAQWEALKQLRDSRKS
jgi:predicted flap endonuclease-1-like 5' DNA nuclease